MQLIEKERKEKENRERIERIERERRQKLEKIEKERKENNEKLERKKKNETERIIEKKITEIKKPLVSDINVNNTTVTIIKEKDKYKSNVKNEENKFIKHQKSETIDTKDKTKYSTYKYGEFTKINNISVDNKNTQNHYVTKSNIDNNEKNYKIYVFKADINKKNLDKPQINNNIVTISNKTEKKESNISYPKYKQPETKIETIKKEKIIQKNKAEEKPLNISKIEQTILTTKYQIKKEITPQEETIQKNIGYKTEKENKQIVDKKYTKNKIKEIEISKDISNIHNEFKGNKLIYSVTIPF